MTRIQLWEILLVFLNTVRHRNPHMLKMGGGALPPAFKPEEGHERRKTGRRLAGAQRLPEPSLRLGSRPKAANAAGFAPLIARAL